MLIYGISKCTLQSRRNYMYFDIFKLPYINLFHTTSQGSDQIAYLNVGFNLTQSDESKWGGGEDSVVGASYSSLKKFFLTQISLKPFGGAHQVKLVSVWVCSTFSFDPLLESLDTDQTADVRNRHPAGLVDRIRIFIGHLITMKCFVAFSFLRQERIALRVLFVF